MMLEGSIYRVIPIIAVPMIISMLIDNIYNMTDTFFVSQLGRTAVAAVGVNDSLLNYMRALSMGFGAGAASVLSRLLGARKDQQASQVATTTLYTAIGLLTLAAAVAYVFVGPMVTLLGATETVKPYSVDYARFILLSAPFTAGEVVCSFLLRSEGAAKLSMIGTCSGCIINVALDPLLITGCSLGVAGAAIATTIAKVVSFAILITPFIRKKTMLVIGRRYFCPRWSTYSEVIKMGLPTFLRSALMTSSWVVMNNIAGDFSDAALAAVSISKKTMGFVASAVMGFGQGYQPLAGFCWGAGKYDRVRESFRICTIIGWIGSVVLGVGMGLLSRQLVLLFTTPDETEIVRLGTIMIVSQCAVLIPHTWGVIINGLCQAIGHPIYSMLVGLSRNFICLIPSILVLSHFFGVDGLALSNAAGDALSLLICIPIVIALLRECKAFAAGTAAAADQTAQP